jgi:hypothetical protein
MVLKLYCNLAKSFTISLNPFVSAVMMSRSLSRSLSRPLLRFSRLSTRHPSVGSARTFLGWQAVKVKEMEAAKEMAKEQAVKVKGMEEKLKEMDASKVAMLVGLFMSMGTVAAVMLLEQLFADKYVYLRLYWDSTHEQLIGTFPAFPLNNEMLFTHLQLSPTGFLWIGQSCSKTTVQCGYGRVPSMSSSVRSVNSCLSFLTNNTMTRMCWPYCRREERRQVARDAKVRVSPRQED